MEQIVKSEVQPNEEILLFYVDENGYNENGVITENNDLTEASIQQTVYIEQNPDESDNDDLDQPDDNEQEVEWSKYDSQRLLTFYFDNRETFFSGTTKRKFLWSVACKTMLMGKTPYACESHLGELMGKCAEAIISERKGLPNKWHTWPLLQIAQQVFHGDSALEGVIEQLNAQQEIIEHEIADAPEVSFAPESEFAEFHVNAPFETKNIVMTTNIVTTTLASSTAVPTGRKNIAMPTKIVNTTLASSTANHTGKKNNAMPTRKVNTTHARSTADHEVTNMLTLYLKHKNSLKNLKKDYWQRGLWETIAVELGSDEDAEYWHKRFLNFKHNYVCLLERRHANGPESVQWPYMNLFDQIFADDEEFKRKYTTPNVQIVTNETIGNVPYFIDADNIWNSTEITVLVKYYFDCFDEFQDRTIPKKFLWSEVGRLLDRNADLCKTKYESLKKEHIEKYSSDGYHLENRIPLEILFDNIICKETEIELCKSANSKKHIEQWKTEEIDEMVQFICNGVEMFKDPVCYYVCWAVIANKLNRSIQSCREQMEELVTLYKTILSDKKENPDMQLDWRYIELFDRIYDYGMDENLLLGYENLKAIEKVEASDVKPTNASSETDKAKQSDDLNMEEEDDSKGFPDSSHKSFSILKFYQKNKLKFTTTKKQSLWAQLGKELSLTANQCAHRFRNLKQVYVHYVEREINQPDKPITWPYYQLCKKVFGYREVKNKLKSSKFSPNDSKDWSSTEINKLIAYFAKYFNELNDCPQNLDIWAELAGEIERSTNACRSKFLELRKSYRKVKTMKTRNPAVKVNWKYFNTFDELYHYGLDGALANYEVMEVDEDIDKGLQEDDDIQCIFVIPEGQEMSDLGDQQTIKVEDVPSIGSVKTPIKWTKKSKKRLLIMYLNYLKTHKNKDINASEMWKEIASKMQNKTPLSCKKMFIKLKKSRISVENDEEVKISNPYYALLQKIITLKPKFKKNKPQNDATLIEDKVYTDVPMESDKVEKALGLYLENVEEFVSPRFEKKYAWNDLSKAVGEPLNKIFNKINYLKTNIENNTPFTDVLKQIQAKENDVQADADKSETQIADEAEALWSDTETQQLLTWYLANLDKFKNPKFVRKYLWIESANLLSKTPLACSKKMSEIRTEYRNMVREKPDELSGWKFYELCQKIYGTGKKRLDRLEIY